jgi:hypothetical protein
MGRDEDGNEFLSLVAKRSPARKPAWEEDAVGDAYGLLRGLGEASTLRFVRPGGKPFTAPYSLLTFVWGDYLPELLLLEYSGFFTVRLAGADLTPLEPLISERRTTWIHACDAATAASLPGAVTAIDILRYYPSRAFAIDPTGLRLEDT